MTIATEEILATLDAAFAGMPGWETQRPDVAQAIETAVKKGLSLEVVTLQRNEYREALRLSERLRHEQERVIGALRADLARRGA